jgi:endonuclease/exonuclease/phosphatase family metal-dependent hydrolase
MRPPLHAGLAALALLLAGCEPTPPYENNHPNGPGDDDASDDDAGDDDAGDDDAGDDDSDGPLLGPWEGGTISAAWLDPAGFGYHAVNRRLAWDVESCPADPGHWSPDAGADLPETAPWSSAPAVDGQFPWDGDGVTAAWTIGNKLYVVSRDRYWVLDSGAGSWLASGLLSTAWADVPEVGGLQPHEGPGVTAAWVDGREGTKVVVASGDRFWTLEPTQTEPDGWPCSSSGMLQDQPGWADAPEVDGQWPWEGITAAWRDEDRGILGVISGNSYWLQDLQAADSGRWKWVASGDLATAEPFTRVEGLTVITYNIASAMPGVYGYPDAMLQKLAEFIALHRADLVGLQEVDIGTDSHGGADMPAMLLADLAAIGYPMQGQFTSRYNWDGGQFGIMALSTRPLLDFGEQQVVSNVMVQWFGTELCSGYVRLFNYHPFPGDGACEATDPYYVDIIGQYSAEMSILTGDFNTWPGTSCYNAVTQTHDDVCVEAWEPSCDNTVDIGWHPGHPEIRIDHVFYWGEAVDTFPGPWRAIWAFSDHDINDSLDISDHYPLITRIVHVAP